MNSLFTIESLASLQGAAAASLLVPNALGALVPPLAKSDLWRRWVSFAIAMAISLALALTQPTVNAGVVVIGLLNGFLVFASAVGINQMGQSAANREPDRSASPYDEYGRSTSGFWSRFWADWFPVRS